MRGGNDRIEDIWGPRTPHGRETVWPVRVDQELADGISEDQVDRWVQSACVLCSNGCGCDIAVKDGRMVGVRGRAGDRINHGRLGPKGLYGSWQWSDQDRLTTPLIRQGGQLVESDWETAMSRIVGESKRRQPLAHGFYTSGQLFLEEYYTLAVIGKAGLGTPRRPGPGVRLLLRSVIVGVQAGTASVWSPGSEAVFVATGMHKWGLSNGTVAAGIVCDLIAGRDNPWAGLYDAGRIGDVHAVAKLLKDNLKVGKEFAAGHLSRALKGGLDHLEVGQGGLFEIDGETVGAYRDPDAQLHTVDPTCTHVGCVLRWNNAGTTWDCNCHGSRFTYDGTVLDGPTTKPLDPRP